MSDPGDLAAFWEEGWRHLTRGVADRRAPARHITFATVSPEGLPEVRTVVLRRAVPSEALLEVQTDTATPKVTALRANPWASLHVWVPRANVQIRATARVEIVTGADVAGEWAKVPEGSRVAYGTEPVPGTPIASVYAYEKPPREERFAVLRCRVAHLDLLHLGERHRRAFYEREDGFKGTWVAP